MYLCNGGGGGFILCQDPGQWTQKPSCTGTGTAGRKLASSYRKYGLFPRQTLGFVFPRAIEFFTVSDLAD